MTTESPLCKGKKYLIGSATPPSDLALQLEKALSEWEGRRQWGSLAERFHHDEKVKAVGIPHPNRLLDVVHSLKDQHAYTRVKALIGELENDAYDYQRYEVGVRRSELGYRHSAERQVWMAMWWIQKASEEVRASVTLLLLEIDPELRFHIEQGFPH